MSHVREREKEHSGIVYDFPTRDDPDHGRLTLHLRLAVNMNRSDEALLVGEDVLMLNVTPLFRGDSWWCDDEATCCAMCMMSSSVVVPLCRRTGARS